MINFLKSLLEINIKDSTNRIAHADILLFCHDVDRSISLNGLAYSPLVDSIKEEFERKGLICLSVALPWSNLVDFKAYGSPICINRSYLIYKISEWLGKNYRLRFYKRNNNVFQDIITKSNARLIVTIGCSDLICRIARENNIFHVELLHGIGYSSIPWGWNLKDTMFLPQGILALDEISFNTFKPLELRGIETKIIPHPYLRRFFGENRTFIPTEWIPKADKEHKWKKKILITLQWAYAGDHGEYVEFSNLLKNGIFYDVIEQIIREERDVLWSFRLHPVHLKKRKYAYLIKYLDDFVSKHPNTIWKETSFLPFPSVVSDCDGNISMSSMSCYDAAVFGVNSLMLCPTLLAGGLNENWFQDLEMENYVMKSTPKYEIIKSWILETKRQKPRLSNLNNKKSWENAFEWMINKGNFKLEPNY